MYIPSRIVVFVSLFVAFCVLAVPVAANAQNAERTVTNTVPMDSDGAVTVKNHDGEINIITWDRSEVQVEARIVH
jgi:hypothetical protein